MLEVIGKYNNISAELRAKLESEKAKCGKYAKYKFYIARPNPDGSHYNGTHIYPTLYTLTPVTYMISEKEGSKRIGLVNEINEKGEPTGFDRVILREGWLGILTLDLAKAADVILFEYLEMHPKNENGFFRDKEHPPMFCRVDELKEAKTRLQKRNQRAGAMYLASKMSEDEIRDFAAAMNWVESDDLEILKDKVCDLADKDPQFFERFIEDKTIEYKATIRRALDRNVIAWIPVENKFVWATNQQTIALLERTEGNKYLDTMADWLITHKNGPDTFLKIKAMLKPAVAK